MSAAQVIRILSERGTFNARMLDFHFPAEVLEHLSVPAKYFFHLLAKGTELSLDDLIRENWRNDRSARRTYEACSSDERLEIHAIIGFVLHETTHKVDILISPFGVQYLALLIYEYLVLQEYLPRVLDQPEHIEALRVLPQLTSPPTGIAAQDELKGYWRELTTFVRKALAWGDFGDLAPQASQIVPGWPSMGVAPDGLLHGNRPLELVTVLGIFHSFRPPDSGNWYLRPMTIFEAKALANTLLYLLNISGSVREVEAYFHACYGDESDALPPDYLFLFNTVARMCGHEDLSTVLATGDQALVRNILLMTSSLGWFALQAPPVMSTQDKLGAIAGNPVLRLFAALRGFGNVLRRRQDSRIVLTDILMELEGERGFQLLQQAPLAMALDLTAEALGYLRERVSQIWNPGVRGHFTRVLDIMTASFAGRPVSYESVFGFPGDGNPRLAARTEQDMELFCHDHAPKGAYADWLDMRAAVLFTHPKPDEALIRRLDEHFQAHLLAFICEFCPSAHSAWVSRFATEYSFICPASGKPILLKQSDMTHIDMSNPGPREAAGPAEAEG